ncbi:unnamed protein product [Rhizoctonia solani]|uniref:Potassium channel domain-containing protein n=1 Tax=Rhizoctonia solani TaxID=456999 RepID=A0A8H3BBA2_9AGAM|nr:unnamed protein product [Rhizoctonia solani]
MPFVVFLVFMVQALLDKPCSKSEESSGFEVAGQTESGENSQRITNSNNPVSTPIWTHIKDYLWGEEDEASRGEYIPNFRWTPILSGIIIPFAILLEIPGLTEHWYIRTIGNKTVETQENSKSGYSAVLSYQYNLQFWMRDSPSQWVRLATFIAIGGLIIHDIINIIAVTTFGVIHGVDDGFTYGQAFWMTVCSTIASVITTVSLIYDWIRTPDFARSALGAMCYSFIMDLSFQNGLYFTVVSIETVGFGDIVLTTTLGRVFSIFYNTFGIINLGLARVPISIHDNLPPPKSFENSYRKRRAEREGLKQSRAQIRAAEQLLSRMGQPAYVSLPHSLDPADKIIHEKTRVGERTMTLTSMAESMVHRRNVGGPFVIPGGRRKHSHGPKEHLVLNVWALSKDQRRVLFGDQGVTGAGMDANVTIGVGVATNIGAAALAETVLHESPVPEDRTTDRPGPSSGTSTQPSDPDPMTLIERFHAELGGSGHEEDSADYMELKERLEKEEKKEFAFKLGVAWSLFVAFWLIGSGVFVVTEGWRFGESMFFCFCTFSTVGYGDFAPKTPAGRAFFVGWALFGIAAMTILISVLTEAYSSRYKTIVHSTVLDRAVKSRRQRTLSHSHAASSPSDMNALAIEVINNARAMREHMAWFVNSSGMKGAPEGVIKVLDDIAEGENMDERVKKDFMSNDEARKTVFVMSFERMLHNLACVAEEVARVSQPDIQIESLDGDSDGDRQ